MLSKLLAIEFSPVAEEICKISRSNRTGYKDWDRLTGELSFFDVASHDTKIRPEVCCLYAAGKATNVIRVLSGLLRNQARECNESIGLKTLLPEGGDESFYGVSAMNGLIKRLQSDSMNNVEFYYETVDFEEPSGKVRKALHVIDRETHNDLINFTPRLQWSKKDMLNAIDRIDLITKPSWLILAGSPPCGAESVYRHVIAKVREKFAGQCVALDTGGLALKHCLEDEALHPQLICINRDEYFSIDPECWRGYFNTLMVHDKYGCWIVKNGGSLLLTDWQSVPFIDISAIQERLAGKIGPTLGAGDAFHAGALFAMQALGLNETDSAKYALAIASVAVRSGAGVSTIDYRKIDQIIALFTSIKTTCRNPV